MLVHHFIKWADSAPVNQRAAAANALARAYLQSRFTGGEMAAAEAALTMLLDDASPRVRAAIAEPLSLCAHAPAHVVAGLVADQPEVSATVLVRSPLLGERLLADLVATRAGPVQRLIASRSRLTAMVSLALAEHGVLEACRQLLENAGAEIPAAAFFRIAERFGGDAELRAVLLDHQRLPAEVRHELITRLSRVLCGLPLVVGCMGDARAERLARDASRGASLQLIEHSAPDEHGVLAAQLIERGELTPGFLIEVIASCRIGFFGVCLSILSGLPQPRVEAILLHGNEAAIGALLHAAGLPAIFRRLVPGAVRLWRTERKGRAATGPQETSWRMLQALSGETEGLAGEIANLLQVIHGGQMRVSARGNAQSISVGQT